MSDIVLRFVGSPVYEGRPGWPAKDLTQEELDARGLDAADLLAYQTGHPAKPRLYEAVKPKMEVKRETKKGRSRPRSANSPLRSGSRAHGDAGNGDDGGGIDTSLHPSAGVPGED